MSSGYSGTPLAKKLGMKPGSKVLVRRAPDDYLNWLEPLPEDVTMQNRLSQSTNLVHLFCKSANSMRKELSRLRDQIHCDTAIWVSWPKKSSKVETDITEDSIREVALPLGLVDIKVCAVSEIWSGLKLVIRKELRN